MPSIDSIDSVQIEAPREHVYDVIRDYPNMHTWFSKYRCKLTQGDTVEEGSRVQHQVNALGATTRFVRTVHKLVPGERIEETYDEGDIVGKGVWTFEEQDGWTTASFHCQVRSNSLLGHIGFAIGGELAHKLVYRGLLAALKIKCELD